MHHYCCYFDHNYLPRALLMIESLRARKAAFHLHALALSGLCAQLLEAMALPEVTVIPLAALESRYPELMGHVMEPEQVADMVCFLASARASQLSGVVYNLGA